MPLSIIFCTPGAWGSGIGVALSAPQIDANNYEFKTAIEALQASAPAPISTTAITYDTALGGLVFTFSDASEIGPVPIPLLAWRARTFAAFATYAILDVIKVDGVGLYLVVLPHTAGGTFDPNITVSGQPALQLLLALDVPATVALAVNVDDVLITSVLNGDLLRYDSVTSKFVNVPKVYPIGTGWNGVMGDAQDLLHHPVTRDITFPANFADVDGHTSKAGCLVNATASTVVTVKACPPASDPTNAANYTVDVGTITISAAGHAGALATTGGVAVDVDKGSILRVLGPATHDTTLSGFFMTLVAQER